MFNTKDVANSYNQIGANFSLTRPQLSAEVISLLPNLSPNASILDLGCGNGVLLNHLPDTVSYIGVDSSQTLLDLAKENHPNKKFILADITLDTTWVSFGSFDLITALAVFHHLPTFKDHQNLLQKIKQHLRPNGSCLISIWRLNKPQFKKFKVDPQHLAIPFHGSSVRHFYAFAPNELEQLAISVGFKNIRTNTTKQNLYLLIS